VEEVVDGTDVICSAQNAALLDGLLTLFHVERSRWEPGGGGGAIGISSVPTHGCTTNIFNATKSDTWPAT
jgi:hypothetical protein